MDRETLLDLIPAYALDALDDTERQAVEALLATDAEAQQLLAEYQAVADVFVLAVPARKAPSSTRAGLQQRLAERRASSNSRADQPPFIVEKPKPRTLPRFWIVLGAAAAVFLVLIAAFIAAQQLNPPDEQQVASAQELYYMLQDDEGAQKIPIEPVAEGVQGDLVVSADGETAILRLAELPQIEADEAYQLWAVEDSEPLSAGLYHWADGHGPYYVRLELAKPINGYQRFGMSIEPRDGSPTPTAGQQIWGLALASSQQ